MTYYFPFGILNPSALSSSFTDLAVTASFTSSNLVTANTASIAIQVISSGSQGPQGPAATLGTCTGVAPQGPTGSLGPSGSRGASLSGCPAGSVLCPSLTPPSGYAYVCIEIPPGCGGTVICPSTLP